MARVAPELQYSDEHEWVAREAGNVVSIGISAVATDALGDIVYVDLPEVGSTVTAGETCGEVESTKSVSDLYSPVTGEVTEINDAVVDDPALINSDPYGAGWLFKVAADSKTARCCPPRNTRPRTVANCERGRRHGTDVFEQVVSPSPGRGPVRAGSGDRREDRRRTGPPARRPGNDRLGEPHRQGRHAGAGLGADQQVRRGLPGQALLRRLRARGRHRAARHRPGQGPVRRRVRERPAALRRAGQRLGDARADQVRATPSWA